MDKELFAGITTTELAELLIELMSDENNFDMEQVEFAFTHALTHGGRIYKPYFKMLAEADEKYTMTAFDTTEDFFFDAINSKKISIYRLQYLIEVATQKA